MPFEKPSGLSNSELSSDIRVNVEAAQQIQQERLATLRKEHGNQWDVGADEIQQ